MDNGLLWRETYVVTRAYATIRSCACLLAAAAFVTFIASDPDSTKRNIVVAQSVVVSSSPARGLLSAEELRGVPFVVIIETE